MKEIRKYGKVAITIEGEFDHTRSYDRLCIVDYNGLSYLSIVDNTNTLPTNTSQWKLLSVQGVKGEKGDKGDDGLTGISFKNITVFKTHEPTSEKPVPDKPVGGKWNVESNTIELPDGWTNEDTIPAPVWISNGTFSSLTPDKPEWTTPQRISGDKGNNGADGVKYEFIYCLTKNEFIVPPEITNSNVDDYVPVGWSPSPKGISETEQVEWAAIRKKDSNGDWMNFEHPYIWAKWGTNGLNGDGVQYIFRRNNGESLQNPIDEYRIDMSSDQYQEKGNYENIDYIPGNGEWTNNPKGVTQNNTHEWCCKRKYKNGVWEAYSNPSLWAKYGQDGYNGISIKTKYIVTDNSSTIPAVNKNNINPGSNWSSIIPFYESPQALWEIQAYVNYKGELVEITDESGIKVYGWTDPILKNGVAGKNGTVPNYKSTYFCKSDSLPNKPTFKTVADVEASDIWLDYPNDSGQWWQSTAFINGTTEEIISWGNVLQVNGQDGIAQDGKYWETRFAVSNNDNPPTLDKNVREPSGWVKVDVNTAVPSIPENGSLWQTWAEIEPGGLALVNGWSDPYRVNGERGPRGYTGEPGAPGPQGPTGLYGASFEILYCLGTEIEYSATSAPNGNNYTGWYWNVPNIQAGDTYQYIWACQGKKVYSDSSGTNYTYEWGIPFKLSGTNGIGEKGVGIVDVENYYAISNSSTDSPTSWEREGIIPTLTKDKPYLWNYEIVKYSDGTKKQTTPQVISVIGSDGRNIINIVEYYYVGPEAEGVTHTSVTWTTNTLYPNDINIYLWNYEEIFFDKGEPIKTNPVRIGNYASPGKNGESGKTGKTIYPAGIYNRNTVYKVTETTCPYVLDTNYNNYYILNIDEWDSTIQTMSPGEAYETYGTKYWVKMDFFESIFVKIGIIANGLIGSAVFNGVYMFSQQGTTSLTGNEITTDYQNFNPNDPFGENNSFYPNICFNFSTGETWLGKNQFSISNNGTVHIGGFIIDGTSISYADEAKGRQLVLSPTVGLRIGTYIDLFKYIGLLPDGSAYFASRNVEFNSDNSGKITSIINWTANEFKIQPTSYNRLYYKDQKLIENTLGVSNIILNDISYDGNTNHTVLNWNVPYGGKVNVFLDKNVLGDSEDPIIWGTINFTLSSDISYPNYCELCEINIYNENIYLGELGIRIIKGTAVRHYVTSYFGNTFSKLVAKMVDGTITISTIFKDIEEQ